MCTIILKKNGKNESSDMSHKFCTFFISKNVFKLSFAPTKKSLAPTCFRDLKSLLVAWLMYPHSFVVDLGK